jgi:hypothetical protein
MSKSLIKIVAGKLKLKNIKVIKTATLRHPACAAMMIADFRALSLPPLAPLAP